MSRSNYVSLKVSPDFFNVFDNGRRRYAKSIGLSGISHPQYSKILASKLKAFELKEVRNAKVFRSFRKKR